MRSALVGSDTFALEVAKLAYTQASAPHHVQAERKG
jgi:hypothetical protein